MKSFLVVLFILASFPCFAQESFSFSLEIGNKYFYSAGRYPDDSLYAVIRTIVDSLSDGTRKVIVDEYYKNKPGITKTEYWSFSNKKLFIYTSNNILCYDGNVVKDTNIYSGPSYTSYKNFKEELFGQSYFCQSISSGIHMASGSSSSYVKTANKVGIYFKINHSYIAPLAVTKDDSIKLSGLLTNGVAIGDTNIITISDKNEKIPTEIKLLQNYPNPFNPTTTISYSISKQSYVELKVFDILGREVTTLVNSEQSAGEYKIKFNGSSLFSGIYIYSIHAGNYRVSRKLVLLK